MNSNNIVFSEDSFKREIIPLLREGLTVPLTVSGGSMEPFLAGRRDTVYIMPPSFPLKKGDIAFFERYSGKIVMHRVCKVTKDGYYFVGDAQTRLEGPIPEKAVFGCVRSVTRKEKTVSGGFTWYFFEKIWIRMIPLRPFCLKLYRSIFRKKKHAD